MADRNEGVMVAPKSVQSKIDAYNSLKGKRDQIEAEIKSLRNEIVAAMSEAHAAKFVADDDTVLASVSTRTVTRPDTTILKRLAPKAYAKSLVTSESVVLRTGG